jgi:hypothetical protein
LSGPVAEIGSGLKSSGWHRLPRMTSSPSGGARSCQPSASAAARSAIGCANGLMTANITSDGATCERALIATR